MQGARAVKRKATTGRATSPGRPAPSRIPRSLRAVSWVLLLMSWVLSGCSGERRAQKTTAALPAVQRATLQKPDLRLVVLTDLSGYLEPCGCTSRPLGGIDRMAALVTNQRDDGVPTALLSAGNLWFHAPEPGLTGSFAQRGRAQEIWKAETLTRVLNRLAPLAVGPGTTDFAYGLEAFRSLLGAAEFPVLLAGAALPRAPSAPDRVEPAAEAGGALSAGVLRRVGNLRVGVVGFADLPAAAGVRMEAAWDAAARAEAARLKRAGAELVVGLAHGDRRSIRRFARSAGPIDFLVHGGLDLARAEPPSRVGKTTVLHAGRQGQGAIVLDLWRRGEGAFRDISVWTRRERRQRLEARMATLTRRIAEWEREGASQSAVAEQKARLRRLRARALALSRAPGVQGNVFRAAHMELDASASSNPSVAALVDEYDKRVNAHNREVFADVHPEPAASGQPHYLGSAACAGCHAEENRWWETTRHGHAYATLSTRHKNYNLSCVGCHVTGYLDRGGSTVAHVEGLENVGCESCHGPASQHASNPLAAGVNVLRDPSAEVCLRCHTPEHSDRFDFVAYRQMMVVPGHGLPAAGEAPP